MAALDRLVWAGGLAFDSYGLKLGVRVSDSSVVPRVQAAVPYGSTPSSSAEVEHLYSLVVGNGEKPGRLKRFSLLYSGSHRVIRSLDLQRVLDMLEAHLRLLLAEMARNRVFLHAGVVEWQGKAILLPGRTFTGKSTLVTALVRAGARYYSDEFAVLDADGRVHPFLKPVSLRRPEDLVPEKVDVETFGGSVGTEPIDVGWIYLTRYREGARFRPRSLSPARLVLDLLSVTAMTRRDPARALDTLAVISRRAVALKGVRGEAPSAARAILERAGQRPDTQR